MYVLFAPNPVWTESHGYLIVMGSGHTVCLITGRHAPLLAYFCKAVLCFLSAGRDLSISHGQSLRLRYWSKEE